MLPAAAPVIKLIDRAVIRMARLHLERRVGGDSRLEEARQLLEKPDLYGDGVEPAKDMEFQGRLDFSCASPLQGVAPESRRIHGKFYRQGREWRRRPVVIMLHGWNGENCYRFLFPLLALSLRRRGISLLMFQLPCHGKRRAPSGPGNDFISQDLAAMALSTRQALADARALTGWLRQQGCGVIGLWGISLGSWLAGLLACHDPRLNFAVLMSPVVRMDRAIDELEFCSPIRRSLGNEKIPFDGLNLLDHRPLMPIANLLLVEGRFDLFTPPQWVEELWVSWDRPPIERLNHGHMSMLFSWNAMNRAMLFVRQQAGL